MRQPLPNNALERTRQERPSGVAINPG